MLQLIRKGNVVSFKGDDSDEIDILKESLTVSVPDANYSSLYREGKWDGKRKLYRRNTFQSGLLKRVILSLQRHSIEYDCDEVDPRFIIKAEQIDTRLREHQKAAVLEFFKYDYGIIKVPTRGGKTFLAAEVIRLILERCADHPIVFFVDTKDLHKQATNDIAEFLRIEPTEIGTISGGKSGKLNLKTINVFMIQTLQSILTKGGMQRAPSEVKLLRSKLIKWFPLVQMLIVDEWHEYSGNSRQRILAYFKNIKHKLCLSATPYKSTDPMGKLTLMSTGGGIVYAIPLKELVKRGVLAQSKIGLITIEHDESEDRDYRKIVERRITSNTTRNNLIVELLGLLQNLQLKTLVLFNNRAHGRLVSDLTGHTFICGVDTVETREIQRQKLLDGAGGVLLASDIWKKGITLPQVQVLINANGGKEDSLITQRVGRVMGAVEGKDRAFIFDILDIDGSYLSDHAYRRLRVYERTIGKDTIEVYSTDSSDYLKAIKAELSAWFEL